ncbi:MAG: hypothetical protein A2275_19185 [Bacteroidetes bacterium RIFOXYA12_FULL_35_11]|nr:MAG: hypothetical protein A2X01_10085 [Bacteroidetes bacterium GWF2_35_48]OFY72755.1 MAG: hypothetical protein A2275_19185 [Bacteroidetes bacterium RIFOXYA12_FULL_35_11]OFY97227.1 MAG: hypothetical protein A2309_11980 [Bacteroidetes bacterium RIFOXYB2_FULL_35_7]OFY97993.1 MAG: hypothetical protein A2491_19110 [Bacteroidetes bacterium RIFOXYC12_FULL_35_7]
MFSISLETFAQENKDQKKDTEKRREGGKGGPGGMKNMAIGKIYGSVIDKQSEVPIEYANVILHRVKDSSLVTGGITDKKGRFVIDKVPPGNFYLKVQFIGYAPIIVPGIKINPRSPEYNAGVIQFSPSSLDLSEVTVTSEKKLIEYHLDKKVVNVEKNLAATGGTAIDVLKDVPSVVVDADGSVSLRGNSNFTILIDGRPSPFSGADQTAILEQIQASAIETIEIITNPSARYQAEGMTGIINIKLKKKMSQGLNGILSLNAGTSTIIPGSEKLNGSVNMNYNFGKGNVFFSYDGSTRKINGWGESDRTNTLWDTINNQYVSTDYKQWSQTFKERLNNSVKLGTDYFINQQNSITGSVLYNSSKGSGNDNDYSHSYNNGLTTDYFHNKENEHENDYSLNYSLFYKKKFDEKDRELTSDITINTSRNKEDNETLLQYYLSDTITPTGFPENELNNTDYKSYNINAQADYVHPLDTTARFETGYKYSNNNIDMDYIFNTYDYASDVWDVDSNYTNHFIYNQQIHAAYGIFSKVYNKFTFQLGLRAEYTIVNSDLKTTNIKSNDEYIGLFPSVHVTRKINEQNDIQISYSRRVNRPRMWSLNPFVNKMSPLQYRMGNPDLKPEYVNSIEIGHSFSLPKIVNVNSSIFYKQINDVIKHYSRLDSITNITYSTSKNFTNADSYGIEMQADGQIFKWWKIIGSGSFFRTIIYGDAESNTTTTDNFSWTSRLSSNMKFWENFDIQISGNFRGPMLTPQGQMKPSYGVDIAMKKDIMKEKASVSLRVSDVFNTQKFGIEQSGEGFTFNHTRKRESQVFYVSFTYKINEGMKQKQRRKPQEGSGGGGDEGEMF